MSAMVTHGRRTEASVRFVSGLFLGDGRGGYGYYHRCFVELISYGVADAPPSLLLI